MESSQVQNESCSQVEAGDPPQAQNGASQGSEVARLLQQIQEEYEAAFRGLSGLAQGVSKHQFMTARTENISRFHGELEALVGEKAMDMVIREMDRASQSVSQSESI